jgi:hypothetical protein
MANSKKRKQLLDGYRVKGFTPIEVKGLFGDSQALVIVLTRRSKKRSVARVVESNRVGTIANDVEYVTYLAVIGACIWSWTVDACTASAVAP